MKYVLMELFIFCSCQFIMAQSLGIEENIKSLTSGSTVQVFDGRYNGVKGTPFFMDKWIKATVYMVSKDIYEGLDVKYNFYEPGLLYKGKSNNYILDMCLFDSFILEDSLSGEKYTFKEAPAPIVSAAPNNANNFALMLLETNKLSFLLLPSKILRKANFKATTSGAGAYSSANLDNTFDQFISENSYFVVHEIGRVNEVKKLNKINLLHALADKEKEMKVFISRNRIDLKTEKG